MLQMTGYKMMEEGPHSLTTNLAASNQENVRHAFPYFFSFSSRIPLYHLSAGQQKV